MVKNLPASAGDVLGKIPWRRKWQPSIGNHPVFLSGKSHGQRSLADQFMGLQNSQTCLRIKQKQYVSSVNMTRILCRNLMTT